MFMRIRQFRYSRMSMPEQSPPSAWSDEVRRLQRLLDAAIVLNSSLSLTDLTRIILEIVRADVPVERVTAFRIDHERREVHSLVAQGTEKEIRFPIGSGVAGTVAETWAELNITDAYADPRFNAFFDGILNFRTRDLLALPAFNRQGLIVGVVELINRLRPINESDLVFLRGMCSFVGLAMENAQLYELAIRRQKIEEELLAIRDRLANIERVTTMAQVLSGVMSEISSPLAVAIGNLGLLKDDFGSNTRSLADLMSLELAIDRTAAAVRQFVSLASEKKVEDQPTDLRKVLEQIVELRSREWTRLGISAAVDLQMTPPVQACESHLQLAFMHLVVNAEQAAAQNPTQAQISVHALHDKFKRQVRIEVADNGPGIPKGAREQVFKPFFTTRPTGSSTGLGLSIARTIVEQHRGRVWFETTRGKGTTFIIELPVPAPGVLKMSTP
jgi:signal transduction histidine kinase